LAKQAGEGTRSVALLIGGLDALVATVGLLALLTLGTTLSWWLDSGLTTDWVSSFKTAVNIWFVMHGVSLNFAASTYLGLEVPAFAIQLLPIGATLLVFAIGWRGGRRLYGSSEVWPGWLGATFVYGALSALLLSLSAEKTISANPVAAYFLPALVYVGGVVSATLFSAPAGSNSDQDPIERVKGRELIDAIGARLNWVIRAIASPALRAATGFVFALQALAAAVLGVMLVFNWLNVIQLFEQLQGGPFGGLGSTLLQLSVLPNFTYYVSTWLSGVGFAIGVGSSVSPLGTALGPLPTLPIFGVIPTGDFSVGMIVLVVPVLIALVVTAAVKNYTAEARHHFATPLASAMALGLSIGFIAALEMSVLAWITHASIGPGRMQTIGADPLWVFVWIFLEVAPIAVLASFYAAKPNAASPIPEHLKR
jgi:hypothetical protein